MKLKEVLNDLGYELPEPPRSEGHYEPISVIGRDVYLSGQLPMRDGELTHTGKVGQDLTVEEARQAAEQCALNTLALMLALMQRENALWDVVVTKVEGYVAAPPDFHDHPEVVNGFSELLSEVMGEKGKHSRTAVGVPSLPLNSPVEISLEAQL